MARKSKLAKSYSTLEVPDVPLRSTSRLPKVGSGYAEDAKAIKRLGIRNPMIGGESFWQGFKRGFKMPFQAIGELGSEAISGIMGSGQKGGKGFVSWADERNKMFEQKGGKGLSNQDFAKWAQDNKFAQKGKGLKSVVPNSTGFGINMRGKGALMVVPNSPQMTNTLIHNQISESPPGMRIIR